MNSSYLIAAGVALAAAGWILSGQVGERERPAKAESAAAATPAAVAPIPSVRVQRLVARARPREIVVRGRTEASRTVQIRAETAGRIVALGVAEGRPVRKGAVLARIDPADRPAALAEARALLRQRKMEYKAAVELSRRGFRAETKLAAATALLDAARARVAAIETDIARTTIRAPFDGVLDTRAVELGDYVRVGDRVATVVDLDPILVIAYVSERNIDEIRLGQAGRATLVDGRSFTGRVRYIASVAEPATRTFRVEIEIDNPGRRVRHGVTAEVRLAVAEIRAQFVSSAVLTLDDAGRLGVKTVTAGDRVAFVPVRIVADTPQGVWIEGLPEVATVITVGQEFVRAGERVIPVPERPESAS